MNYLISLFSFGLLAWVAHPLNSAGLDHIRFFMFAILWLLFLAIQSHFAQKFKRAIRALSLTLSGIYLAMGICFLVYEVVPLGLIISKEVVLFILSVLFLICLVNKDDDDGDDGDGGILQKIEEFFLPPTSKKSEGIYARIDYKLLKVS